MLFVTEYNLDTCLIKALLHACILFCPVFNTTPSDTCVARGQPAEFYCNTRAFIGTAEAFASQEWIVQTPGNVSVTFRSFGSISFSTITTPGYEWIVTSIRINDNLYDLLAGLRVVSANSSLDGATFQCIAFFLQERNTSAPAATLEVAGGIHSVL